MGSITTEGKAAQQSWASCSHLCTSVTKQCNLILVEGQWCSWLGRCPQAWQKVMAAYHQGMTWKVVCGLTACTPGSAPGPTLGYKYGRTLPFIHRGMARLSWTGGWLDRVKSIIIIILNYYKSADIYIGLTTLAAFWQRTTCQPTHRPQQITINKYTATGHPSSSSSSSSSAAAASRCSPVTISQSSSYHLYVLAWWSHRWWSYGCWWQWWITSILQQHNSIW